MLGGRLIHLARDTEWGMALRSHFFVGADLPDARLSPAEIEQQISDDFGRALLQHAYDEFTFLPSLYIAEHRHSNPPRAQW